LELRGQLELCGDTPNPFHPPPREDTPRISLCEHEHDLQELASDISVNNKIWGEINYNNVMPAL